MTDEQNKLAEIRARVDKATLAPWEKRSSIPYGDGVTIFHGRHEDNYTVLSWPYKYGNMVADADFIAHARNDIPYLLDLVAAKEERIVELDSLTDELRRRLDLASTFSDMQSERIAQLEQSVKDDELAFNTSQDLIGKLEEDLDTAKKRADTEHLNNGVLAHQYNAAVEKIKELEAKRDAAKKKFDEMCFGMSLLRQSKEAAESQVASLREALEAIIFKAVRRGWKVAQDGECKELIAKAKAILESTKGAE